MISSAKRKNPGLFESIFSDKKHIQTKVKAPLPLPPPPPFSIEFSAVCVLCGLWFWPPISIWCLKI